MIDDPRCKALIGFVPETFNFSDGLSLRDITVHMPKGMPYPVSGERYVAMGITSLDDQPLATSQRMLLSVVNTSFNTGLKIDKKRMATDLAYAHGMGRSILSPGHLPVVIGRVGMTLQSPWLTGCRARMLDYNERVIHEVTIGDNGQLTLPTEEPIFLVELTRNPKESK